MSSIPEEIYLEILSRVPVKSTFVCKCVCKTWFSIISDPVFVKMHLYNSKRNNSKLLFTTTSYDGSRQETVMRYIGYDALLSPSLSEGEAVEMPYPGGYLMLSSCDGLVCLKYYDKTTPFICVWNPATTEHMKIPKSTNEYGLHDILVYALCYDQNTNDYKLIVVVDLGEKDSYLVDVYRLETNSWKSSTQILPFVYMFRRIGNSWVFVKGSWHWLAVTLEKEWLIICLDIRDEKLKKLQLPEEPLKNTSFSMTIGVLEGCLCALISLVVGYEVWVMQDYGVRESWTKRHIISRERINMYDAGGAGAGLHNLSLIWSFKGDVLLLRSIVNGNLIVYDTKHSSAREANKGVRLTFDPTKNYVESLVSLNTGNYRRRK